jgi:dCMP deaminase
MKRGAIDAVMMGRAVFLAEMSKDPSTKVGCIIARDNRQISEGYNGFPEGVYDCPDKLGDRTRKLLSMCHAEVNAVAWAARNGIALAGATAYITHPPCGTCAALLIQAGVKTVIHRAGATLKPEWAASAAQARQMLSEAGIPVIVMP